MSRGRLDDNFSALEEHEDYARSIAHDPSTVYKEHAQSKGAQEVNTALHEDATASNSNKVDELTEEAIALAEAGDVAASLPLFESALSHSPLNSQLWQNLGVTQVFSFVFFFLGRLNLFQAPSHDPNLANHPP